MRRLSRRVAVVMFVLFGFLCIAGLALTGYFATGAVLSSTSESPRRVDVVVVLGGDPSMSGRYALGRDLVLAGYSTQLVLVYPSAAQVKDAQISVPGVEVVASTQAPDSAGSWAEAISVRDRMQARGLRTVMVVSDPPHMLRLHYTWGSVLRGTGLRYTLVATSPLWWPGWRWWRNPQASDFVGNEVLKLGYYLVKYRFGF